MLANILVIDRALSIIFIILVIFFDKKKPESSLAWILVLTFLPYLGVTLYILFSDSFRFRIHKRETEKLTKNKEFQKEIRSQLNALNNIDKNKHINSAISLATLNINADNLITSNNKLHVYNKGIDMFVDLLEDIANAKKFIHLSYYIIQKDKYGERLKNALIRKLKEGVEVRLIYDQIGSKCTNKAFFKDLINSGAKVERFFPATIFFKPYFNHRNHRKMVIIDGCVGYVGGMNIGGEYCNEDKKLYPWSDRHIKVEGNAISSLQMQFFKDYLFVSNEKIDFNDKEILSKYFPLVKSNGNKAMQVVASGPDYKDESIKNSYLKMINSARKCIYIETPYLVLDDSLMDALKVAVKSGVEVNIVIPSIPDKWFVYAVTLSYARELIANGVNVYAYKGFMHSKVVIMDDLVTSIGSANLDRRSFYLNFEINAIVYDKEFSNDNIKLVKEDINNSEYLNGTIKKKNKFGLWLERILRLLAPLM